jgi:hypothetical protein
MWQIWPLSILRIFHGLIFTKLQEIYRSLLRDLGWICEHISIKFSQFWAVLRFLFRKFFCYKKYRFILTVVWKIREENAIQKSPGSVQISEMPRWEIESSGFCLKGTPANNRYKDKIFISRFYRITALSDFDLRGKRLAPEWHCQLWLSPPQYLRASYDLQNPMFPQFTAFLIRSRR